MFATVSQRGMRESTGSAGVRPIRAAAGGLDGGATSGAGVGSTGAGARARTLCEMRTAEAPSPTQNALHAVLINRSIVPEALQASAVPTLSFRKSPDDPAGSHIPALSR